MITINLCSGQRRDFTKRGRGLLTKTKICFNEFIQQKHEDKYMTIVHKSNLQTIAYTNISFSPVSAAKQESMSFIK